MNCHRVQNLVSAFVDSELSGMEMLAIRQHMHECSECRTEFESLLAIKKNLGTLNTKYPRNDLAERICQRLDIYQSPAPDRRRIFPSLRDYLTACPARTRLAAVGASMFAVLFMLRAGGIAPEDYPSSPTVSHVQVNPFADSQSDTWFPTIPVGVDTGSAIRDSLSEATDDTWAPWKAPKETQFVVGSSGLTLTSF